MGAAEKAGGAEVSARARLRITVRGCARSRGFWDRYEAATEDWPVPPLFGGRLPAVTRGESPGEALLQMLLSLERDGRGRMGRTAEVEDETGRLDGWTDPVVHVGAEAWERREEWERRQAEGSRAEGSGVEATDRTGRPGGGG